jgi:GntR family transcriptional regulator, transcriptional repressor for pyruvate dehydrogenase complex
VPNMRHDSAVRSPRRQLADGPVQPPRVPEVVADRVRTLIMSGQLRDGELLPPLDVLVDQFGVSGPSIREAQRILESEGLITVQRGGIGGAVVHYPNAKTAAYNLALVLQSQGTKIRDVLEATALLEPMCAMLCARRADRKRTVVRKLRNLNDSTRGLVDGDELTFYKSMTVFHETVVSECGNDTVRLMAGTLELIWLVNLDAWAEAQTVHGISTRSEKLKNLACHEEICDLIEAGDDIKVAQVLANHVDVARISEGLEPSQQVDASVLRRRT